MQIKRTHTRVQDMSSFFLYIFTSCCFKGVLFLASVFRKSQDHGKKSQSEDSLYTHRFPDINSNVTGNDMISGKGFVNALIPVNRQKLRNLKHLFVHNTHRHKDPGQETHAKRNNIGDSTEHVAVFDKKADQIRKGQRNNHHQEGVQKIVAQNTG